MEETKTKEFSGGLWGNYPPKKKLESRQGKEDVVALKDEKIYQNRYEQCAECVCYYLNNEEGGEVREAMDKAQIECSNEYTFVDPNKPCFCFSKVERK